MSAIPMTCKGCGVQYVPPHECPSPTLTSLAEDPTATPKLSCTPPLRPWWDVDVSRWKRELDHEANA